jgi:branched-chain amino acid transport system ATP-binding protein
MLRIEGLTPAIRQSRLNGVSIKVEQGQFVAIVGPNGAGKTTLFKTISGIVRPSAGAITFEATTCCRSGRRARISASPTSRKAARFSLAHGDGKSRNGRDDRGRPARLETNIERIFEWLPLLAERRGQFAGTLSGGSSRCWRSAAGSPPRPSF